MQFLIDEDLPRSAKLIFQKYNHVAFTIKEIALKGAKDSEIATYALKNKLCIVTGDFDFSDIRNYPPSKYHGIIVLSFPSSATASFILNLIEEFLKQSKIETKISGHLAIVEVGRIRWRSD